MDIQQVLTGAQDVLAARRVFGDPIRVDDATVIPVATVRGGGGGGVRSAEQAGAGFGVDAHPAGVYVVREGNATWRPAVDVNRVILGGQFVAIVALLVLRPVVLRWMEAQEHRALAA